MKTVTPQVKLL